MRIRFLQTIPSGVPEFPFMAGQIIDVPATDEWLALLRDGCAVALKDSEPERAVAPVAQPVSVKKPRKPRARA